MKIINTDKIAIIEGNKKFSYKDLIIYINTYDNLLKDSKTNKVVLFFENRIEWVAMFLAIWKSNKIVIPIDADVEEKDLKHMLNDCNSDLIICSPKTYNKVKEGYNLINIEDIEIIQNNKIEDIDLRFNEKDLGAILYTSGTSSKPIGVELSKYNLFKNVEVLTEYDTHNIKDVVLIPLPFHHSYPLTALLQILNVQATLIILKDVNTEKIRNAIADNKPTSILTVPLILEKFHKEIMKRINANSISRFLFKLAKFIKIERFRKFLFKKVHNFFGGNLRVIPCGGAHLDQNIQRDFETIGIKVSPGYGLTETAPLVAAEPNVPKIGSSGKIVNGMFLKIIDDEIIVKGNHLMLGYHNNPELTNERIKDGWFYTGDLGYLDNEGYLYITGRKKELIVLANGKNIWPTEIEKTINDLDPIIKDCVLIESEGMLKLLVIPNKFYEGIENKIKQIVNDKYNSLVQSYKKIKEIKIINKDIPRTRLGKIQRYKLKDLL